MVTLAQKNKRLARVVFGVVLIMVALSFASVPMYRLFCRVTGLGGVAVVSAPLSSAGPVSGRVINVRFDAGVDRNLPWDFSPTDKALDLAVGQEGMTAFTAQNDSQAPITGTAIYSVLPEKAGKYFHKTQCFCFGEQTLNPGQKVNMPVLFYIDPAFLTDPNMDDVRTITLSYTFYKAESDALTRAIQGFEGSPVASPPKTR